MRKLFLVALCVFLMAISSPLWAQDQNQEIVTGIEKSIGMVKAGKYSEAIGELKFAIGQLQELVMAGLIEEMKQVFSPWKADVQESSQAGMAFFGGGFNLRIDYRNADTGEIVQFEVIGNSPLIQTFSMWMSNPMFLGQGKSLVRLGSSGDIKAVYDQSEQALQYSDGKNLYKWTGRKVNDTKPTLMKFGNHFADNIAPKLKNVLGE